MIERIIDAATVLAGLFIFSSIAYFFLVLA